MTHLRIENENSNVEIVNVAIILKLYNLALDIELNLEEGESLSDYVSLKGNLLADHARLGAYNYLTGNLTGTSTKRFPLLDINVTGGMYLDFGDPSVENILKQNSIGDGIGITSTDLYNVNALSSSLFGGSSITSFNELLYFKTTIFNQAEQFKNCSQLTSVILPSGTTSLHHGTFLGCISLTNVLNTLNLTSLANYTFKQCSFLSIDLLNITYIGDYTFQDCTNLQNIGTAAPNSVGNNAFNGCTALRSITLHETTEHKITNFAGSGQYDTFGAGCANLIKFDLSDTKQTGSTGALYSDAMTTLIYPETQTSLALRGGDYGRGLLYIICLSRQLSDISTSTYWEWVYNLAACAIYVWDDIFDTYIQMPGWLVLYNAGRVKKISELPSDITWYTKEYPAT